jgi:hypothetical protein
MLVDALDAKPMNSEVIPSLFSIGIGSDASRLHCLMSPSNLAIWQRKLN